MRRLILTLLISAVIPVCAWADISGDLTHYFDELGMTSNSTSAQAYHGQQAGYYSGGSLYARNTVRNVQLVGVDLPSFRSGCGGIDVFAGGFSFVNSDELVRMMRNVMNNAKGYAMTLALEEVTPQIANVMKYIQDMANKANQMNINSCETAEALVGGVWPRTRAAQQQVCQDIGSSTGIFSDWAQARQGCTSDDFDNTMQAGSKNPAYKNIVLNNGNIVWKALQTNALISGDRQLSELLMSLSGSIIIKKNGAGKNAMNHFEVLQSLSANQSLFKAILYGGKATIYQCDEIEYCLNPKPQTITVTAQSAFKNRVAKLLNSISQKIVHDDPISEQEKSLIQSTHIPIYKILNVQAAYQKGASLLDVESYSDIIGSDILFQYLQENLEMVRTSSRTLQYPAEIMTQFNEGITIAMTDVRAQESSNNNKIAMSMQLIEQSQLLEQMLAGQLSVELGNSLYWARSLR